MDCYLIVASINVPVIIYLLTVKEQLLKVLIQF